MRKPSLGFAENPIGQYDHVLVTGQDSQRAIFGGTAVGRKFDCSDVTAEKTLRFNYESQGLSVPIAATRREERHQKVRKLREQGLTDLAIAEELDVSSTTLHNFLNE